MLDRETQCAIFETPVTTIENAEAPVTPAGTHACPGWSAVSSGTAPTYHPA